MKYGYVRVSTKEQNIDRQLADMYNLGLTDSNIFIDNLIFILERIRLFFELLDRLIIVIL